MAKKHNDKGYLLWKNLIADYKNIDPDTDITYDYEGYYNKYPGEAWSMLRGDSEAHFTDEFKTVYHPTFSILSSYSGKIHPLFNPGGLEGGTWKDNNTFVVSDDLYKSPVNMDQRIDYLIDNEPNGAILRESDGSLPYMSDGTFYGGVLPEVTVTPKKYDTGGSLKAPLDWNDLTMKEKAAFIRMGVSNGYKDIDSIRKIYNEFKKGGKKLGASEDISKKIFLGTLNESLRSERGRKEFSHYDTPEWRRYLTELALKESSYRANVFNDIGALGYFQLMPANRSNKGGKTWLNRTLQFYDMYKMTDSNYKLLKKLMKPSDWTKAASLGIDIYGLLGGAHLGGVGGVIKALRGVNNAKDKNGSSVLGYMRKFSLSNRAVPESDIQDIYPVMHQDTNYLPLPMYELLYTPQAILSFNLEEPLITIPMEAEESPVTAVEEVPTIKEPVYREVSPLDMVRLFNNQIIQMLPTLHQLPTTATEILKALELKRQLEQKESLLNSDFLSYINANLNMDNLFPIGGPLITVNKGDRVSTDQCAQWSNGLLRDNGYLINGNAWNLNNVDMLFNGFDGLTRPEVYDSRAVALYNHLAADNVYKNFDSKTLDVTKPYVVNMYYNNSPSLEDAYNDGDDVTGTHTGVLTYDDKKKQWYVTHNIHGNIHQEPFISLLNGKGKYGVTAIYSPREATIWNRLKGAFGFAEGGNLFDDGGDKDNIFRYTNSNGDVRYVYQDNPEDEEVPVRPLNTIFPDPAQWTFTDDAGKFYTPRRTTPTNTAELNPDNRTGFERALDNYIGEAFNTVPKGYHTLPAIGAAAFGLANPALGEAALTSGFGAHGLSKWMNGEIHGPLDAAMTALEIAPLGRLAKPIVRETINAGKMAYTELYTPWKISSTMNRSLDSNPIIRTYESNPMYRDAGTLLDYQDYIQSIYPNSKINDIVYHNTSAKPFEAFDPNKIKIGFGFYFSPSEHKLPFSRNVYAKVNIENPLEINRTTNRKLSIDGFSRDVEGTKTALVNGNHDGLIGISNMLNPGEPEIVALRPEQIHILGSNHDLAGFKRASSSLSPQITAENAITRAQEIQELIPRYNKFAEYYGYDTVPEGVSVQEAENLIKEGLKQHNTFYRGLTYPEGEKLEAVKKVLGENASREEIMDYLAKAGSRDPNNTYFSLDERANQYARTGDVARYTRKYILGDNPATWLEDADFAFDTTPAISFAPRGSINYPWAGSYIKEAPGEVRINPEDVTFEGWMPKTTWEYGEYVKPSEYKANRNLYFNENAGGTKPTFEAPAQDIPTITAENAASITPEQWNAAYRTAYEAGDTNSGYGLINYLEDAKINAFLEGKPFYEMDLGPLGVRRESFPSDWTMTKMPFSDESREIINNSAKPRILAQAEKDIRDVYDPTIDGPDIEKYVKDELSYIEKQLDEKINEGYELGSDALFKAHDKGKTDTRTGGLQLTNDGKIVLREGESPERFAVHEWEHRRTNSNIRGALYGNEKRLLRKAFTKEFRELSETVPDFKGMNMDDEMVTTVSDTREALIGKTHLRKTALELQNKMIDKSSDEKIFAAVEKANAYGSFYIERMRELGKLTPELAQNIREALKHVGAFAAPLTVSAGALYGTSNQ